MTEFVGMIIKCSKQNAIWLSLNYYLLEVFSCKMREAPLGSLTLVRCRLDPLKCIICHSLLLGVSQLKQSQKTEFDIHMK